MKAILVHGSCGNPEENWFPWLKKELEKKGWEVLVPQFPTPEKQSLGSWLKIFENYEKHLGPDTILIGHSIGSAFILSVLEMSEKPVGSCFLVAGFTGKLGSKRFDPMNKTFAEKEFDWKKIRKNCKRFVVFCSDNDPYVPGEKSGELADKLGADFILVKGAGHFNTEAGYSKFELLLKKILSFAASSSSGPCFRE